MQERMRQHPLQTPRLFGLDHLVLRSMENMDRAAKTRIVTLEPGGRWNKEGAFLRRCTQLFGPNRQRDGKIFRKFFRHRSWREKLAEHSRNDRPRYDRRDRVSKNIAQNRD